MPVIYPKVIRDKLQSINLNTLKDEIINKGYSYIRDGGFKEDDEPFKFCNYLFYVNKNNGIQLRIGYDIFYKSNIIFEICYCHNDCSEWRDVIPDFRKNEWRKISKKYHN